MPLIGLVERGHEIEQRGLSRPVRPYQGRDGSSLDLEMSDIDGLETSKRLLEAADVGIGSGFGTPGSGARPSSGACSVGIEQHLLPFTEHTLRAVDHQKSETLGLPIQTELAPTSVVSRNPGSHPNSSALT